MNETCQRVDAAVGAWAQGSGCDSQSLFFIINHTRGCPRCNRRHGTLIPLLRRDAGEPRDLCGLDQTSLNGFTDRVMRRATGARVLRLSGSTLRAIRWALPAAGAVAILLGVGAFVLRRSPSLAPAIVMVHFSLEAPSASGVTLAGDFNGWRSGELVLAKTNGLWEITVPLRKGGIYTYDFLIDGKRWVPDPLSATQIDDDFGGLASVLRL